MTIQECYAKMGGDYEGVLKRLGNESRIRRLLPMFLRDTSFELLEKSLEAGDFAEAFRGAHSLKGVCFNLGLAQLGNASVPLTEALRGGVPQGDIATMFAQVKADYELTVSAIRSLD